MIIVQASSQSVMIALDTIQAKGLMHIIRWVLEDQSGAPESYAAKKMIESGLPISPMDLMMLVGQIAVTMGRVLTEAEIAAASIPTEVPPTPDKEEKKEDSRKIKGVDGIKDGSWKH